MPGRLLLQYHYSHSIARLASFPLLPHFGIILAPSAPIPMAMAPQTSCIYRGPSIDVIQTGNAVFTTPSIATTLIQESIAVVSCSYVQRAPERSVKADETGDVDFIATMQGNLTQDTDISALPRSSLCSPCLLSLFQSIQQTSLSSYNEDLAGSYQSIQDIHQVDYPTARQPAVTNVTDLPDSIASPFSR